MSIARLLHVHRIVFMSVSAVLLAANDVIVLALYYLFGENHTAVIAIAVRCSLRRSGRDTPELGLIFLGMKVLHPSYSICVPRRPATERGLLSHGLWTTSSNLCLAGRHLGSPRNSQNSHESGPA